MDVDVEHREDIILVKFVIAFKSDKKEGQMKQGPNRVKLLDLL